jgi:hypothetical protein
VAERRRAPCFASARAGTRRLRRLASLEFLLAGDAALSRRAKSASEVYAVVVRFSRSRKRYERQGLLVQPQALRKDRL